MTEKPKTPAKKPLPKKAPTKKTNKKPRPQKRPRAQKSTTEIVLDMAKEMEQRSKLKSYGEQAFGFIQLLQEKIDSKSQSYRATDTTELESITLFLQMLDRLSESTRLDTRMHFSEVAEVNTTIELVHGLCQNMELVDNPKHPPTERDLAALAGLSNSVHQKTQKCLKENLVPYAVETLFLVDNKTKQLVDELETLVEDAAKKRNDIQKELSNAKELTSDASISKHAAIFKERADNHQNAAYIFLALIPIYCFVIYMALPYIINIDNRLLKGPKVSRVVSSSTKKPKQLTNVFIFQTLINRTIVLSAVLFVLLFITRNYNAHRHNQIVNQHRADSLRTYQAFLNNTNADNPDDKDIREAMLLKVTECIFNQSISGYMQKTEDPVNTNQITSILKGISKS